MNKVEEHKLDLIKILDDRSYVLEMPDFWKFQNHVSWLEYHFDDNNPMNSKVKEVVNYVMHKEPGFKNSIRLLSVKMVIANRRIMELRSELNKQYEEEANKFRNQFICLQEEWNGYVDEYKELESERAKDSHRIQDIS